VRPSRRLEPGLIGKEGPLRSGTTHAERTRLSARDADASAVLVEERTLLLTELLVRRVLLSDDGEERARRWAWAKTVQQQRRASK